MPGWSVKSVFVSLFACFSSLGSQFAVAAVSDTTEVNRLLKQATDSANTNPDFALTAAQKALGISNRLKWRKGRAKAYNSIGDQFYTLTEFKKSADAYKQALDINQGLADQFQIARTESNLGLVYLAQSAYPRALEFFFRSLKHFEETGNKLGIGNQYGAIGTVYNEQKDYVKAMHYDSLAMLIFREINDREGVAIQLGNIGNAWEALGEFEKAIGFDKQALDIYQAIHGESGAARNMMNIGIVYNDLNQCVTALDYILRAEKVYRNLGDETMVASCLGNAGQCYLLSVTKTNVTDKVKPELIPGSRTELLQKALSYMLQAHQLSESTEDIALRQFLAQKLSETYSLNGNFKEALNYLQEANLLKDSIFTMESHLAIENLTTEREVLLKDKQIEINKLAVEKKRNERVFYIIGIGLVVVILAFVFRSYVKQKRLNIVIEKEKQKSEELLLNILPEEVAEELKDKGSAVARQYDKVTVLFTDFIGFTRTSELMTAAELVGEINYMYSEFDRIISKYNIEKIKTIGDSYMCAGGLPDVNSGAPSDVVSAALEIRDFVAEIARQRKSENKPYFETRIGCHTGPVVAGIVGIKKFAYDIWGDTVNLASRMESSGVAGMVNISHDTWELVKQDFACEARGKVSVKNKGEVEMYFVLGKK